MSINTTNDWRYINAIKKLFAENWISPEQFYSMHYDHNGLIDSAEGVEICDNGDAIIHTGGAYPYVLPKYTTEVNY